MEWDAVNGVWKGNAAASQLENIPDPLYIFGYGSLLWKPGDMMGQYPSFPCACTGFVRLFAQKSMDHRGTADFPGFVVTLVPDTELEVLQQQKQPSQHTHADTVTDVGTETITTSNTSSGHDSILRDGSSSSGVSSGSGSGSGSGSSDSDNNKASRYLPECIGNVYLVPQEEAKALIAELDYREKGGYHRHLISVRLLQATPFHAEQDWATALVYTGSSDNPNFSFHSPTTSVAGVLASAVGQSGENAEYFLNLTAYIRSHKLTETYLWELEREMLMRMCTWRSHAYMRTLGLGRHSWGDAEAVSLQQRTTADSTDSGTGSSDVHNKGQGGDLVVVNAETGNDNGGHLGKRVLLMGWGSNEYQQLEAFQTEIEIHFESESESDSESKGNGQDTQDTDTSTDTSRAGAAKNETENTMRTVATATATATAATAATAEYVEDILSLATALTTLPASFTAAATTTGSSTCPTKTAATPPPLFSQHCVFPSKLISGARSSGLLTEEGTLYLWGGRGRLPTQTEAQTERQTHLEREDHKQWKETITLLNHQTDGGFQHSTSNISTNDSTDESWHDVLHGVANVVLGHDVSLVLMRDGRVVSMGKNTYGACIPSSSSSSSDIDSKNSSSSSGDSSGSSSTSGSSGSGDFSAHLLRFSPQYGILSRPVTQHIHSPTAKENENENEIEETKHEDIIYLAVGLRQSVAVAKSGAVYSWGDTRFLLPQSHTWRPPSPQPPAAPQAVTKPLASDILTPTLTGIDTTKNEEDVCIPSIHYHLNVPIRIINASCGAKHTILVDNIGRIWSFGENSYGQLGREIDNGITTSKAERLKGTGKGKGKGRVRKVDLIPSELQWTEMLGHSEVAGRSVRWMKVYSGWSHNIAKGIYQDGTFVFAGWGRCDMGQIPLHWQENSTRTASHVPDGDTDTRTLRRSVPFPQLLPPLPHAPLITQGTVRNIREVWCGSEFTIASDATGLLWGCGWGEHGNLAHHTDTSPPSRSSSSSTSSPHTGIPSVALSATISPSSTVTPTPPCVVKQWTPLLRTVPVSVPVASPPSSLDPCSSEGSLPHLHAETVSLMQTETQTQTQTQTQTASVQLQQEEEEEGGGLLEQVQLVEVWEGAVSCGGAHCLAFASH